MVAKVSLLEATLALHLNALKIEFKREAVLIKGRKWRVDFLVHPNIVIECNGGIYVKSGHSTGAGISRDYEKSNEHQLAGYKYLQVTMDHIKSGKALQWIEQARKSC